MCKMKMVCAIVLFAFFATFTLASSDDADWWKNAVVYQIYPRSFKDSNNDGNGDLKGIIEKLDHLVDAGITAFWLSPIYKSPQVDQGYDISDFRNIDELYGTMDDFDELLREAHKEGLKVILDFVPNHSSDKHEWFIESSKGNETYKDYYVWMNGKYDASDPTKMLPPNNWVSVFKNSSWTWSDSRQQYYLHQFAKAQPDLNYRNPKVVQAMQDVLKFWLDKGIDGFRCDAVPFLVEVSDFRDEPKSNTPGYKETDYEYLNHTFTKDQQETYDIIYGWRKLVDDYTKKNGGSQRILMTEAYTNIDETMLYYGTANGSKLGAHFSFNFNLITGITSNSTALDVVNILRKWLDKIPPIYVSNWVLGNHDNHRVASRFGPDNVDGYNMLVAVLPGAAVTYNGEEIGMEDGKVSYNEGQDPSARDPDIFEAVSRDFERTPYQWNNSINGGFNDGYKGWLPVSDNYKKTNLKDQTGKNGSHYEIYKELIKLRKRAALKNGSIQLSAVNNHVLLVNRTSGNETIILLFNIGNSSQALDLSKELLEINEVLISTNISTVTKGHQFDAAKVNLKAHEAIIFTTQSKGSMAFFSVSLFIVLMSIVLFR